MTETSEPTHVVAGYTGTQIFLHWTIAALVVFQIVLGEDITAAYRAFQRGTTPTSDDLLDADIHVYVGLAVLALAVWRLGTRLWLGVPALPREESVILRRIATATHFVLYAAIFGMPITGILTWYAGLDWMGEIHEIGKPIIVVMVTLHAAGALWQHFYVKSDVLVRMLKPARRRSL